MIFKFSSDNEDNVINLEILPLFYLFFKFDDNLQILLLFILLFF